MKHNAAVLPRLAACLFLALLAGCAGRDPETGARYRVLWSAERVADHVVLGEGSASVRVEGAAQVKTGQREPAEGRPAVSRFAARVQRGPAPGVLEVVSRTSLTELIRTPKGKLKRQKRVIGALIPMRPGERQLASSVSDPIAVTLQLERAPGRP